MNFYPPIFPTGARGPVGPAGSAGVTGPTGATGPDASGLVNAIGTHRVSLKVTDLGSGIQVIPTTGGNIEWTAETLWLPKGGVTFDAGGASPWAVTITEAGIYLVSTGVALAYAVGLTHATVAVVRADDEIAITTSAVVGTVGVFATLSVPVKCSVGNTLRVYVQPFGANAPILDEPDGASTWFRVTRVSY